MAGTVLAGTELISSLLGAPPWTPMNGSYTNAWSDTGGGNVTGQYRLWKLLNEVEIIGVISHVSISGASAFFTLPAGFRPATTQGVCGWFDAAAAGGPGGVISATPAGVLTAFALSSSTEIQFHGWLSLDA